MIKTSTNAIGLFVLPLSLLISGCKFEMCQLSGNCRAPSSAEETTLPSLAPPTGDTPAPTTTNPNPSPQPNPAPQPSPNPNPSPSPAPAPAPAPSPAPSPSPAPAPSPTPTPSPAPSPSPSVSSSRGLRLDPGYFYSSHPGQTPSQIANDVITQIKQAGGNTIYLYAYNSIYGAFYPTTYAQTTVESGLGAANIFQAVTQKAKLEGFTVVAVVPLNNFKSVWTNNPSWRVKQAGGVDYKPFADTYQLSASVQEYKDWYAGFIDDLVTRNPLIDAVEAVEPTLDYNWNFAPDQNPAALSLFNTQYPGSSVGSANWKTFRAQEFLNLIAHFNQRVHANSKKSYVVQTWTVDSSGHLLNANSIKQSTGFDFIGVTKLTGTSKTDVLIVEFIWQQWKAEYGTAVFNPTWITSIGSEYLNTMSAAGALSELVLHVEISTFSGSSGSVTPTDAEFSQTVQAVKTLNKGISLYDYNQIRTRSAFDELSGWVN